MNLEATVTDSSVSLQSKSRRLTAIVGALALVAVLGICGYVVFGLATQQPGEAACDRLDELNAERVVKKLERRVSASVVRMKLTEGTERVEVTGCPAAMETLAKATSHKQFSKLVDCIAGAKTENAAAACL